MEVLWALFHESCYYVRDKICSSQGQRTRTSGFEVHRTPRAAAHHCCRRKQVCPIEFWEGDQEPQLGSGSFPVWLLSSFVFDSPGTSSPLPLTLSIVVYRSFLTVPTIYFYIHCIHSFNWRHWTSTLWKSTALKWAVAINIQVLHLLSTSLSKLLVKYCEHTFHLPGKPFFTTIWNSRKP